MLLITATRMPKGYRFLATSSHRTRYYCWSLYRNETLLSVISRSYQGEQSVNFDLRGPLAPGTYTLRVECFGWVALDGGGKDKDEKQDELDYYTEQTTLMMIGQEAVKKPPQAKA
jgi:hypothetical protein